MFIKHTFEITPFPPRFSSLCGYNLIEFGAAKNLIFFRFRLKIETKYP